MDYLPLRVLHVIETLSSGGAERLLVTMLPNLVSQGVHAEVVVLRPPLDLQIDLEAVGITVHLLPKRGRWSLLKAASDLARIASVREIDIIHAHLYFPTAVTALSKLLKLFHGVTHATFHNLAYSGANKNTWKLALRKKLMRTLVSLGIDQPQAVSQASAEHFSQAFGLRNVVVINNAFDVSVVEAIRVSRGDSIVLPGRLVAEKGHLDLIAALTKLRFSCPPVIFAGEGPLRAQLEVEIAKTGLPISITGKLNHIDMLETIAMARLVVIPSRFEGFGLTALEALALGTPIVASTAGGLPEVLGDVGFQVPPGDAVALSAATEAALCDKEWAHAQDAAGRARASKFDVSVVAKQQINLYQQTLSLKGTH